MSNFMHKVKDAVSDHRDKDRTLDNENAGTANTYHSTNPYHKDSAPTQKSPSMMDPESGSRTGQGLDDIGTATGGNSYGSATAGVNSTNAGPHRSNLANKLDPRVDSDLDHRAQNTGAMPSQNVSDSPQGMTTSNMAPGAQARPYGSDNHKTDQDNYNRSTQGRKTHTQPGVPGSGEQITSEDSYSNSTQEHKSHSTTTHATPCQMNPGSFGAGMGAPTAQPELGGGGAAGGSSYTQPPARGPAGTQNPNAVGKGDQYVQNMDYQPNDEATQRSVY